MGRNRGGKVCVNVGERVCPRCGVLLDGVPVDGLVYCNWCDFKPRVKKFRNLSGRPVDSKVRGRRAKGDLYG